MNVHEHQDSLNQTVILTMDPNKKLQFLKKLSFGQEHLVNKQESETVLNYKLNGGSAIINKTIVVVRRTDKYKHEDRTTN